MPRYPTNIARRVIQTVERSVRADSFQGRRGSTLARRSIGSAANRNTQPVTPRDVEDIAELALGLVGKRVAPRLFPWVAAALTAYELYELLKDMKAARGKTSSAEVRGIPSNYGPPTVCTNVDSFDGERRFTGNLSACGATPAQWAAPDTSANPASIGMMAQHRFVGSTDVGQGTEIWWSRLSSVPGQQVSPEYVPAGSRKPGPLTAPRVNPWPALDPAGEPVEVPGMPIRPEPMTPPWSVVPDIAKGTDPAGRPNAGYQPEGEAPPVGDPLVQPPPVVLPWPGPGIVTIPSSPPGLEVVTQPGPRARPYQQPSGHQNARPNRTRHRERKFVFSVPGGSWAGVVINAVTEADDFIDDLWEAIDKEHRRRGKMFRGPDGKWHRAKVSEADKVKDLWRNWDNVDIRKALHNVVVDQLTDHMIGRLGRYAARAQQNVYLSGFGDGIRNAGSPSGIANHREVPTGQAAVGAATREIVSRVLPF